MHEWTETMEKTLDIMRKNALKLSELSLYRYHALKSRIEFMNIPLAILSGANAAAIFILDNYVNDYIVTIACGATSATIAGILSCKWFYQTCSKNLEEHLSFHHKCEAIGDQIQKVLHLERSQRKTDSSSFLIDKFAEYKALITNHPLIDEFNGNLTICEDSIGEEVEDMYDFVYDHWNIIFRPTLRRFKQKNKKLLESIEHAGLDIQSVVEPETSGVESSGHFLNWSWSWIRKKATIVWVAEESTEKQKKSEEEEEEEDASKYLDLGDIYRNTEKSAAVIRDSLNIKKFNMNFVNKK
jgi:hypothetical protein